MKYIKLSVFIILVTLLVSCQTKTTQTSSNDSTKVEGLRALIIDGDNNHGVWPKTTFMMKDYLEQTGLFEVDVERTAYTYQGPHFNKMEGVDTITNLIEMYPVEGKKTTTLNEHKTDPNFSPDFDKYDLVVSNFGWQAAKWPEQTRANFVEYMKNGGGLIVVHAANNSWGDWPEFNKMIGLGGWGGRDSVSGPYIYYNDQGERVVDPKAGNCGAHGAQLEFIMKTRSPEHAIMKGLPSEWLHAQDELYEKLRGPGENVTVLSTAYSERTKRHEPILMTVEYGQGRIFHSTLGHMDYSMECAGFITTFQRGAEWASTGKVTQSIPDDFPTAAASVSRAWNKPI